MTSASSERGFQLFAVATGPLLERPGLRMSGLARGALALPAGATHFGVVTEGTAELSSTGDRFRLRPGMFFVAPGAASLEAPDGAALVITRFGYAGLRQLGGPVEATGRLSYIDGCSDTLLVCPPRLGEPCLNHLHIPAGTDQSEHTHPSIRLGAILSGRGVCRTGGHEIALAPGAVWAIEEGCAHSFATREHALDVIAWHPDSDFGPRDEDHPMVNRTILRRHP